MSNYNFTVIKRDGSIADGFHSYKITEAMRKCFIEIKIEPSIGLDVLTDRVCEVLAQTSGRDGVVQVEQIQDVVEIVLTGAGEYEAAKAYAGYRDSHTRRRKARPVSDEVKAVFADSKKYFFRNGKQDQLGETVFFSKYSQRILDENGEFVRRETWEEAVKRSSDFLRELSGNKLPEEDYADIHDAILNFKVMPSMRLMAMAGPAARRSNIVLYNCSYLPIDSIDSLVEVMIVAMAGCGVGYSVESKYTDNLPLVKKWKTNTPLEFIIPDSAEGWAEALKFGLEHWFKGQEVAFDYSLIRAAGTPLKTKPGTASGPDPLRLMMKNVRDVIKSRQRNYLRPIDVHDIVLHIASCILSGGVRRTAQIALFDRWDTEMLNCKHPDNCHSAEMKDSNGKPYGSNLNTQRWAANNSAVWEDDEEITDVDILEQFTAMFKGYSGEPGIFNRSAANRLKPFRRKETAFGCNPCGEINLRPFQFCNLTTIIVRPEDTEADLKKKQRIATIIGTIQASATHFPGLRPIWAENCREEALLGTSLSGIMDNNLTRNNDKATKVLLLQLREHAFSVNLEYAEKLGINPAAAITCTKPDGNSSLLGDFASGIHVRWSPYYIRRIREARHTALAQALLDAGVPASPENGQTESNLDTWVFSYPVAAPKGSKTRKDLTAIQQCEVWLRMKKCYTEHNPSVTIYYEPDEMIELVHWVAQHKQEIGGMAFLPRNNSVLPQLPYEEIDEETYKKLVEEMPQVDFSRICAYEWTDETKASQELACLAGACEVP